MLESRIDHLSTHFKNLYCQERTFHETSQNYFAIFRSRFADYLDIRSSVDHFLPFTLIYSDNFVLCKLALKIPYTVVEGISNIAKYKEVEFFLKIDRKDPECIKLFDTVVVNFTGIGFKPSKVEDDKRLTDFFDIMFLIMTQIDYYNSRETLIGYSGIEKEDGILLVSEKTGR